MEVVNVTSHDGTKLTCILPSELDGIVDDIGQSSVNMKSDLDPKPRMTVEKILDAFFGAPCFYRVTFKKSFFPLIC